jgi:phage terminase large subunit GpA-like protein
MDEVDRYPASAGTEGDPCALAERRTETYWNAVIYKTSSPTVKGFSRIEAAFLQTDQRRWFCPCPKCQTYQTLKWSQVKWGKHRIEALAGQANASDAKEIPEGSVPDDGSDAIYECESCHEHLTDVERRKMILAGEWRATAPFKGKRGYHLNGIASPFKAKKGFKNRLHQMVSGFIEARAGGPETYKTWVNTFLAETYEEESERIEHGPLLDRGEGYSTNNLPEGIVLLAAGVDVQKTRLEVEIEGIGLNDESWGVEYLTIEGDTEQDDVWEQLGEKLGAKYQRDDGVELSIAATAIDMRHKGQKVRDFVRHSGVPRVYPVYGIARPQPLLVTPRFSKHYRIRTFAVATKNAKDTIFARLRIEEEGPRYMHFPKGHGYDEHYFEMLTAEVLKTKYSKGIPTQTYEVIPNRRNEALDIRVYILAALDILKPNLTSISKKLKASSKKEGEESTGPKDYPLKEPAPGPAAEKSDEAPETKAALKTKKGKPFTPRPGGFVGRWKKT